MCECRRDKNTIFYGYVEGNWWLGCLPVPGHTADIVQGLGLGTRGHRGAQLVHIPDIQLRLRPTCKQHKLINICVKIIANYQWNLMRSIFSRKFKSDFLICCESGSRIGSYRYFSSTNKNKFILKQKENCDVKRNRYLIFFLFSLDKKKYR